ncbi:LysM peptidoglycan-binding domain-containing protein [Vannielia litorea]|uniref:LysM peptidoglycan-binding domain-containing protein n=1 Tax=Vannielia litorea TaxID=1217970 RepID=UPI001C95666F|nr:LysM peptidoglycan-binding domain-containing protein [Vannielia litorea]MBY6155437.1 LysM peptidoglycan-binding domain-containing protein [Vannielia litorea]
MFRALVTASALLTATLAAVLFMPGVGRDSADLSGGIASTGEMLRSGGLVTADVRPVVRAVPEVVTAPEAEPEPEPVAAPVVAEAAPVEVPEEVVAEAPAPEGPLADEATLAAMVALSAPALEEMAEAPAAPARAVVEAPLPAGEGDMRALSAGVLAGFGLALPEEQIAPAVTRGTQRRSGASYSSRQALGDAQGWSTDYVLIGLGQGPRKVTTPLEEAQEWSTAYVLNRLADAGAGTAGAVEPAPEGTVTLEEVIAKAMKEGRSDEELIALIDELSAAGRLDAPAALLRPDGQVDSGLVLNALVHASTAASDAKGPAPRPARRLSKPVTYTVRRGDSLAAIAYRFYGITSRYTEIFEANREALPSPDQIRAGQRLTIPAG